MLNVITEKSHFEPSYFSRVILGSGDVLTLSTGWDDSHLGGWQFCASINMEGVDGFDIKLPASNPYNALRNAAERLGAKSTLEELSQIANFLTKHKLDSQPDYQAASGVNQRSSAW